jgi:hypothetical protein
MRAVLDLPTQYEGQAYGFDSDFNIELVAGKVVFAGGGQWPGESPMSGPMMLPPTPMTPPSPTCNIPRRNHGGVFVPLDSADPADGLPGLWVFGGRSGSDAPHTEAWNNSRWHMPSCFARSSCRQSCGKPIPVPSSLPPRPSRRGGCF